MGSVSSYASARDEVGVSVGVAGWHRTDDSVGAEYDFNWQTYYMFREPLRVPKGSRIVSSAWYDNSARNRSNPDPNVDVSWGDQTWEEMQYTGLLYSAGAPARVAVEAGRLRATRQCLVRQRSNHVLQCLLLTFDSCLRVRLRGRFHACF